MELQLISLFGNVSGFPKSTRNQLGFGINLLEKGKLIN